jgi:adenylyltransferase/sulfurtransferase
MNEDPPAQIEIAPQEVSEFLTHGKDILLVDVREKWEHEISRIESAVLIPMSEIPASLARLKNAGDIVLYCHHGVRSFDAAAWLRSQGIVGARSMSGGIERWAIEIDPRVPRY